MEDKETFEKYICDSPYAELNSRDEMCSLKIYTYNYEFPEITKGCDADWQQNYFRLMIPSFTVEINEVILESSLLKHFLTELQEFSVQKRREVNLSPTEPYFRLSFSFSSSKQVDVKGWVQYPVGYGARLEFMFETDLLKLNRFKEGIQEILLKYPPRL